MKFLAKTLIFIVGVLLCAELLLQVIDRYWMKNAIANNSGSPLQVLAMNAFVGEAISRQWTDATVFTRPYPFRPPFPVFLNRGWDNERRMDLIASIGPLMPNRTWTVPNFLRRPLNPADDSFTVTTNRFGYRDPERTREKKTGVFRIFVLGTYPAFGHGVNDDQTYARRLEAALNARAARGAAFEVWNGGRQGSTAITGLARMQREIAKFRPDLVILDYGWIEPFVQGELTPHPDQIKTASTAWMNLPVYPCHRYWIGGTLLCRAFNRIFNHTDQRAVIAEFRDVMGESFRVARAHGWPVLFLRQSGVVIPTEVYRELARPAENATFLDLTSVTRKPMAPADIDAFWAKPNWLSELGVDREEALRTDPSALYRVDAIQLNEFAYREIAARLEAELVRLTREGKLALPVSL